jgi:hypothetical protein
MRLPAIAPNSHARAERLRAVLLVLAVWAVGVGLAAVFVCPGARRAPPVKVAASEPCILLTVDPQSAGPAVAERVDTCPGDCTTTGAYCVRIIPGKDRP